MHYYTYDSDTGEILTWGVSKTLPKGASEGVAHPDTHVVVNGVLTRRAQTDIDIRQRARRDRLERIADQIRQRDRKKRQQLRDIIADAGESPGVKVIAKLMLEGSR